MQTPEERLIPTAELRQWVPYGRTRVMQLVAAGTFPRPVKLSSRRLCWRASDLRVWIAAKAA
jgi:predicted DNA-binding transcriptional regulator AlpA